MLRKVHAVGLRDARLKRLVLTDIEACDMVRQNSNDNVWIMTKDKGKEMDRCHTGFLQEQLLALRLEFRWFDFSLGGSIRKGEERRGRGSGEGRDER